MALEPTEQKKICPLLFIVASDIEKENVCLGKECAVFIKLVKPKFLTLDIPDPDVYFSFEGCGLIHEIPWVTKHRDKKEAKQ